jgi:hypothetical protein
MSFKSRNAETSTTVDDQLVQRPVSAFSRVVARAVTTGADGGSGKESEPSFDVQPARPSAAASGIPAELRMLLGLQARCQASPPRARIGRVRVAHNDLHELASLREASSSRLAGK